jgi:polyphenol oxidase
MRINRRRLLEGSFAGAAAMIQARAFGQGVPLDCLPPLPSGAPVSFVPPAGQVMRVRKSAFELDDSEQARLRNAYAALRKLSRDKPDDPRGWLRQGLVHCWYCSGAIDALNGQEIHGGWWFLPWHRAFLYFHEAILATLIGDASFALPYWDWDSPGQNRVPDVYATPADDSNPLYDATRKAMPSDRIPNGGQLDLVGPPEMQSVLGQPTFALFGGSGEGGSGQMGALEGTPHGGVHLWCTDPIKIDPYNPQIDMGVLATAALDPVFFAHHANIDRLWDKWIAADPSHTNPSDPTWQPGQAEQFVFYDQHAQWTAIAVNQVVDHQAGLSYSYQPPQGAPAPVAAAAPNARASRAAVSQTQPSGSPLVELNQNSMLKTLTPNPTTLQIPVPGEAKERLTAALRSNRGVVLHVDGVQIPANKGALIKVYLNNPEATAATSTDVPTYVGTIVVVPAIARGSLQARPDVVRNVTFALSPKAVASLTNRQNISVTLVPVQGQGATPPEVSTRYRRVYLTGQ